MNYCVEVLGPSGTWYSWFVCQDREAAEKLARGLKQRASKIQATRVVETNEPVPIIPPDWIEREIQRSKLK